MTTTYNPKKVTCSLGSHMVRGYAEDGFIAINPNGDGITKKVGCDGEIVRSASPDDTFVVQLVLLQNSETNGFLERKAAADRENGSGMFPILIKDMSGSVVFQAAQAWVVRSATRAYGRESGNREWEIHTGSGKITE